MKFFFSLLLLLVTALSYAQTTNMPFTGSTSITGCSGTIRDHGGNGNYSNYANGTLTICSGSPTQFINLNFSSFNTEAGYDFLKIYSGVGTGGALIANLTGTSLSITSYAIPNNCVTLVFTSDGSVVNSGYQLTYNCTNANSCTDGIQNGTETGVDCGGCSTCPPCTVTANPATVTISASTLNLPCGGGTVNLTAQGVSTTPVLVTNFNAGTVGPGWSFTGSGMFTNPCGAGLNGTYMWFGNASPHPRVLKTNGMDLTCGGTICFNMKFAVQGANGSCEGPDLPNEGITLQYSTNCGVTFQNIAYFHPNGTIIGANPNTTSPGISGPTLFTNWANYCFTLPPGALSSNTIIQWSQLATSGAAYDHWGIDEVVITKNNCNPYYYDWAHAPGSQNSPSSTVNVVTTTTYDVIYTNGINDTATASVTVNVAGPVGSTVTTVPVDHCVGINSGSATFTSTGTSNPPFTFTVNGPGGLIGSVNGNPSATMGFLAPGNYTLETTDASGCSAIDTFSIGEGPHCCDVGLVPTNLTCNVANASCDGAINSLPVDGVGPYTFQWYSGTGTTTPLAGQTAQSINSLCAGTYTVQISDQSGCTDLATVTLTQPSALTVSNTHTNLTCNGVNIGSINATASGGTASYLYNIGTSTNSTGIFTSLSPGTYNVQTTDANGCTATTTATITQPTPLSYTINSITPATCGLNNGSATVAASGGTTTYSYTLGATTNNTGNFTNLSPGTYTVQINDFNGCSITTYPIVIGNLTNPVIQIDSIANETCFGSMSGFVLVSASGNANPNNFTYSFDGGVFSTINSFNNLSAGSYIIEVQDSNSCSASTTVTITSPPLLSLTATTTNATCNGLCNGTITNTISGGVAPYVYSIDGGVNYTNPALTGLCPNSYLIVYKDANGCLVNQTVSITQPTPIVYTATATPGTCGVSNGSYTFNSISGGAGGPYTISYDGSLFSTTNSYTGLDAGFDTILIQDVTGCEIQGLALINNIEAPFIVNVTVTDNLCFGGTAGAIEAITTPSIGGLPPPYFFSINGGPSASGNANSGADNLFAGLQNGQFVTQVMDGNGCISLDTLTITSPTEIQFSAISENINCNGETTGSIQYVASGGTPGYMFSIDNGSTFNTTGQYLSLGAGTYFPLTQDNNLCIKTLAPIVLTEPTPLVVAPTFTNPLCFDACNGTIQLPTSGGTPGYLYSINNGTNFTTNNNFTSVCSGTIDYMVKDSKNCTADGSLVLINPAQLNISSTALNASCGNANGSITANGSGGTGALTYSINNGIYGVSNVFNGLNAGTYSINVTDNNSCVTQTTQAITQSGALTINNIAVTNPSCFGGTGSATVNINGGTPSFSYQLNGGFQQTSPTFSIVPVGPNTITVTDALGCTASSSFTIIQPAALAMNAPVAIPIACNGNSTGSISLNPSGGTTPYQFSFNGGTSFTSAHQISAIPAGSYNLQVQDANGCLVVTNVTLSQPPALTATVTSNNATCFGYCDGDITLTTSGGVVPYSYNWTFNIAATTSNSATGVCAGNYNVTITDNNNCTYNSGNISINEMPLVEIVSATSDSVNCFGETNGGITVVANNVVSYTIDGPSGTLTNNTGIFTGLLAGYYDITVANNLGCEATTNIMVYEPELLTLNTTGDVSACYDIPVTYSGFAVGGTSPFTYTWNTGYIGQSLVYSAIAPNILSVTVTDNNGCSSGPEDMNITVIPQLTIDPIPDQYVCAGDSVFISATAQFGVPDYIFNWSSNPATLDTNGAWLTGSSNPSVYTVVVKDLCIHYDSVDVLVYEYQAPTFDLTGPADGCAPQTETFNIINSSSPLSNCTWDFGNTNTGTGCATVTETYADAGVYSVQFSYEAYTTCPFDTTFTNVLEIFEVPVFDSIVLTDPLCFGSSDGTITAYGGLGTLPYNYQLDANPTQAAHNFSGLASGSYLVTLSDANTCFVDSTVTLIDPPLLVINTIATVDILCFGGNNGSITVTASGGTSPLQYSFDGGTTYSNSNSQTGMIAGLYDIFVRDTNLCVVDSIGVELFEPPMLEFNTFVVTNASCYNVCDGEIAITTNGGVAPTTYVWSANAATGDVATASSLCDDTYDVEITDANGCSIDSLLIAVTEPPQIVITSLLIDSITCNGFDDGTITAIATNGVNYELSGAMPTVSNATGVFNNLIPGTYTLTIFDVNLCSIDTTVTVYEPLPLTLTNSGDTTVCYAVSVDHTATSSGGTQPYTYTWDTGFIGSPYAYTAMQDTAIAVLVEDANGCTLPVQIINITVIPLLNINPITTQTVCIGDSVLTFVTANDGMAPYVFQWSNLGLLVDTNQQYLHGTSNPSSYWVYVTDQCGNVDSTQALVDEYQAPTFNLTGPVDGCAPQNENFSIVGASSPISNCTWDFGNTLTATGCGAQTSNYTTAGIYSVLFSYEAYTGCQFDTTFTNVLEIYEVPIIDSIVIENPLCFGSSEGTATVFAHAGTPNYSYQLGAGALQTNTDFTGLSAGLYPITLSDVNNCVASDFINLVNPAALGITSTTTTPTNCFGTADGSITVIATGGTPNYQYSSDGGITYSSNSTMSGLLAGNYHVYVRDTNLCTIDITNVIIDEPSPVDFTSVTIVNASCFGFSDGSITVVPTGGIAPYSYNWSTNAATGNSPVATNLAAGSYSVTITDDHMCTVDSINIQVSSPNQISITSIATDSVNCFGGADGSVVITGVNLATYSIMNSMAVTIGPQANNTFNGLVEDTYTLAITDINGCAKDSTFQIFQPMPLTITAAVVTNNLCNGDNTGGIEITAAGGTGSYSYSFDGITFGSSNSNATLAAGTYTITVQDVHSCTIDSMGIIIMEPSVIQVDLMDITNATCFDLCNGEITATVSGGTGPYTYTWNTITPNPGNTNTVTGLCDGTYDLSIMDDNGCVLDTLNNSITEPLQIEIITITTDSVQCFGGSDGNITITATNASNYFLTGPVNANNTTGNFTGLLAGTYQIELQDIGGCSIFNDTVIYEPAMFSISSGNDTMICENTGANLTALGNGGTTPYTFVWTGFGPGANQVASPSITTYYYLNATDANGCQADMDSTLVTVLDPLTITTLNDTTLCLGGTTPASISILTGVPGYNYVWAPAPVSGQGTANAVLSAGNYSVTVTDQCGDQVIETIAVSNYSEPTLNITGLNSGCAPHTVVVNSNNATISSCTWNFGNGNVANGCGATTNIYNNAGTYSVSFNYVTAFGCPFDTTIVNAVTVSATPVASFTYTPNEPNLTFNTVQFTNTSVGGANYSWNFGGVGASGQENPTFTFPSDVPQDYNTCLTVTNIYNNYTCSSDYCILIPLVEAYSLYVPNAFTPNNNEHNNEFKAVVLGEKEGSFVMQIFNRWGEMIFETHDHQIGWDGTYNNEQCPDGIYIWKIQLKAKNVDDNIKEHGQVTLIR